MIKRRMMAALCGAALTAGGWCAGAGTALAAQSQDQAQGQAPWQVYTTAQGSSQRFAAQALGNPRPGTQPLETETAVFVDTRKQFQQVFGFGGAVTDATAEVYAKLTPAQQKVFLAAYFDPKAGLGYSILRTTATPTSRTATARSIPSASNTTCATACRCCASRWRRAQRTAPACAYSPRPGARRPG
jgi:glucosylceramidase